MRGFLFGCLLALIPVSVPASAAAPTSGSFLEQLADAKAENARLHRKLGKAERRIVRLKRRNLKLRRANRARLEFGAHGLTRGFLCIHEHEGAWNSATGNGYHGGLQMDSSFMSSYGPNFYRAWGGAENWPPFVQVAVGINAYLSGRGFHPWPNTARMCGLL